MTLKTFWIAFWIAVAVSVVMDGIFIAGYSAAWTRAESILIHR